jgi:anti-sigma regulatory factor (Ser/Thr protein kinase)
VPSATLSIPPSVEHVRTARLVAVAAARRAGLTDEAVDDVRLAVGEIVARAVLRHGAADLDAAIDVVVSDDDGFRVEVHDGTDPERPDEDDGIALALVRSLVPEVSADGGRILLRWPADAAAAG